MYGQFKYVPAAPGFAGTSSSAPLTLVIILSAVDEDTVPIVEANEADVVPIVVANEAEAATKAPDTFVSTSTISEAREADVDVNAPDTFDSTLSILVCNEPVAVFNAVVVASNEAVV